MAQHPNEYHVVAFDPGGRIGWAYFIIDLHAFSRPENKILANVEYWNSGYFDGSEAEQEERASKLIRRGIGHGSPLERFNQRSDIVSEDFELTQLIGGKDLLSPVRVNAVLEWETRRVGGRFNLQKRQLRTGVTKERLKLWGFTGRSQKDEFAAVQHAITWLRRLKAKANIDPWKLSDSMHTNAVWDCACSREKRCDLNHAKR